MEVAVGGSLYFVFLSAQAVTEKIICKSSSSKSSLSVSHLCEEIFLNIIIIIIIILNSLVKLIITLVISIISSRIIIIIIIIIVIIIRGFSLV